LKRMIFVLLAASLLLAGCAKQESNDPIKADNITIFYGVSSYAMFSTDQSIIDDLLNRFSSLSFEKTAEKMELFSAYHVNFSYKGKSVKSFRVDKNGVFWLDGETQCYKISSGSFDYQHLKAIYNDSKNTPEITTFPVIKGERDGDS